MNATNIYEFGDFVLDPAQRSLLRRDGAAVSINAKAFDALVCLVERAGQVVPRAALAEALWPTTIVEDNNLSQTVLALRRALGDDPDKPRYVDHRAAQGLSARRGGERPRTPRAACGALSSANETSHAGSPSVGLRIGRSPVLRSQSSSRGGWLLAVDPTRGAGRSVERTVLPRSVAVLPCQNLSPREEDAYFAAGMHEEVLDHLAGIRDVNVIASTSVQRYAGGTAPISAIAADLNVGAVVECSVRYAADSVRVSVRLIDGATAGEIWSDCLRHAARRRFRRAGRDRDEE